MSPGFIVLEESPVAGTCEHSNVIGFHKGEEFLDQLTYYQLLKELIIDTFVFHDSTKDSRMA
jgi:hypothetical protein